METALSGRTLARGFRRAQWRTLFLIMFCYLFFYTGRQNFGFAARGMQADMALSATALGLFNAALLAGYAVGQVINGNLGDIYGARRMVTIGAYLSVALNWMVSYAPGFVLALMLWGVNGVVQSCAWPAMTRTIANWWPRRERGKAIGMYLLAAGCSSALTFVLCILVISHLDWRWVFRLPVLLMLVGGTAFGMFVRNSPEDDGFASLPAESHDAPSAAESSRERYRLVLRNRPFQLACLSIGCESVARYGLINWVPMHFLGAAWRESAGGLWITIALPVGMAVGALTAGLVADRWFPENRSRVVLYFLGLGAVCALVLATLPVGQAALGMVLLAVTGFLVSGPQATYWTLCPELVGRERASTAAGVMDAFAYGFAALGQVAIGRAVDAFHTTAASFVAIGIACVLGAILILPVTK